MKTTDDTQVFPALNWSDPRIHLLDDTWVLTIFAILIATALPLLLASFVIDFVAVAMGLLVLGGIHVIFSVNARSRQMDRRQPLLIAMHIAGVITIGFIWLHAGALQNPAFLVVFALPVISAIFLSRWQPYVVALLTIVVAASVALSQAPELRWYAPGLNTAAGWLAGVVHLPGVASGAPFPGFYAPSSYFIVLLEVFAILTIACAVAAEYLGTVFERLYSSVAFARTEAERGQELWVSLIENLPLPAFLIDADSSSILHVSAPTAAFCLTEPRTGTGLFKAVHFSFPDVIQELIAGSGGVEPFAVVTVAERLHVTVVSVQHMAQKGRRLALVTIKDITEEFHLRAALDVTEQAVLVISSRGLILAFNKPAGTLFPGIMLGTQASELLSLALSPPSARWWDAGMRGRRRFHMEIAPRVYQVTSLSLPLSGEEEPNVVATFLPVARAALGDRTTIVGTGQFPAATDATRTLATLEPPS